MLLCRHTVSLFVSLCLFPICLHGQPLVQRVNIESTVIDAESEQLVVQPHQSYNVTCSIELVNYNTVEHGAPVISLHPMKLTTEVIKTDCENDNKYCYKKLRVNDSEDYDYLQCKFNINETQFYSQAFPVTVERVVHNTSILPTPTMTIQPMAMVSSTTTPGPSPYDHIIPYPSIPENSCMCAVTALPTSSLLSICNSQIGLASNFIIFILTTLLAFHLNINPDKKYIFFN